MSCYKLVTYISDRNDKVRLKLEGKPVYVIEEGCILLDNFDQEDVTFDDLLSDLRVAGIEQLGQIRVAILEHNGQLSLFQFEPDAVRVGLPILPKLFDRNTRHIHEPGEYACCTCGNVTSFQHPINEPACQRCHQPVWVKAVR